MVEILEESGKRHTEETLGKLGRFDIRNRWTGGGKLIIIGLAADSLRSRLLHGN